MIVVSDTSPINYLVLIGRIVLLPELLGEVVIPTAVFKELQDERTPAIVSEFIRSMPEWMSVRETSVISDLDDERVDPGEREAILLAEEIGAEALLIDDLAGRDLASKRGLIVIGTIGVLQRAAEKGLLNFATALSEIKEQGFRIFPNLENEFLRTITD